MPVPTDSSADLAQRLARLEEQLANAQLRIESLSTENRLLREKIQALLHRYFGNAKNESLDAHQLLLLLAGLTDTQPAPPPPTPPVGGARNSSGAARQPARSGIPDNLPVERVVLLPDEVKANPEAFRQIDEVVTKELDWDPARFFGRHYVRPKFVLKASVPAPSVAEPAKPDAATREKLSAVAQDLALQAVMDPPEVFIATLPNRLIEKGLPGVGLLVHLLLSRFEDHLPFYRLENIFLQRHDVPIARQSMVDWTERMATWLQPIYRQMIVELVAGHYLVKGDFAALKGRDDHFVAVVELLFVSLHEMRLPQGQLAFAGTEAEGFQVRFKFQIINADSFYYIFYFASLWGD